MPAILTTLTPTMLLSIDSRIALFHSATPPQATHLRAVVAVTAQFAWQAANAPSFLQTQKYLLQLPRTGASKKH